jgi:periplasmic divalent cation tolerance protein
MEATIVLCTVPTELSAQQIARTLVEEQLAACVSIIAGLRSVFRWEGNICEDPELLLLIKTRHEKFNQLSERLQTLHPYEVPEILALPVTHSTVAFMAWLYGATETTSTGA